MGTTNYVDTFIEVAEDCPVVAAEAPRVNPDKMSVAAWQYTLLSENPYRYTSDDLLFEVHARRDEIAEEEWPAARTAFFAKPQACLRSSPLAKRYGWGLHHDAYGRVALVGLGTEEYTRLASDPDLTHVRAMRSTRRS